MIGRTHRAKAAVTRPDRQLTTRYVVALSTLALLAILGYGVERMWRPRASDAQLIVVAARQRMLGQQITKSALAAASATNPDERSRYLRELENTAVLLKRSHQMLRFGDREQGIAAEDDLHTLEIFDRLEQRLEVLLRTARALDDRVRDAHSTVDDVRRQLLTAESQFMSTANDLVLRYAEEASAHVRSSDGVELALTMAMLVVLVLQGGLVFAPAVQRVRDGIATLEEAQANLSRVAAIVEFSGDAIAATTPDGDVQSWNHGADKMFGRPASSMIGRNISDIFQAASIERVRQSLARVAAGETVEPFDSMVIGPHGTRLDVSLMMSPITASNGGVAAVAVIGRDITQRVQAQKMKSDFVSFVSHQLRTPLAGIKWMLELAAESPDLPEAVGYVADARESADRLVSLVNDLLDVSRLEDGRLALSPKEVRLEEVTRSLIAELDGLVRQKSLAFTFVVQPGVPPVQVDAQLIRQALGNLVSNAVKYTPPEGRINLTIDRENGAVRWKIQDSGIGIPAAAQPRLFEKFFRAENALVIETEGTGLGLYLVRLIVMQSGGAVSCASEEGKGATFVVTLPAREAGEAKA